MHTVVLVEGNSDLVALHTLAGRRGVYLEAEGVEVVAMGGITNTLAHLKRFLPTGARLAGLYDAAEAAYLHAALARADVPAGTFFGCDPDLEYEFIRALGFDAIERVIAAEGELRSLELLAGMPAQQGWTRTEVMHRFLGVRSGRKARYARLLVEAVDLAAVPAPLTAVLDCALADSSPLWSTQAPIDPPR